MDKQDILDLTVETVDEFKLGFGTTVCLALVVDFLGDFLLQDLWWLGVLQDLVLAQRQKTFEQVLGNRETDDELLPREERPVEKTGEALWRGLLASCRKRKRKRKRCRGVKGSSPVRCPSPMTMRASRNSRKKKWEEKLITTYCQGVEYMERKTTRIRSKRTTKDKVSLCASCLLAATAQPFVLAGALHQHSRNICFFDWTDREDGSIPCIDCLPQ